MGTAQTCLRKILLSYMALPIREFGTAENILLTTNTCVTFPHFVARGLRRVHLSN